MTTKVFCRFTSEKLHHYPDAINARTTGLETQNTKDLGIVESVEFLKYPHRHLFYFRVDVDVENDNREIEFILMKRQLSAVVESWSYDLGAMSCEMIAHKLFQEMETLGYTGWVSIEVSEDNENGAIITEFID